jgi:hypothetical protein
MFAVVVVAVILALGRFQISLICAWCVFALPAGALYAILHRFQRLAALTFGLVAASINCAFLVISVYYLNDDGMMFMLFCSVVATPVILGLGAAWAMAACRRFAIVRRPPSTAWLLVFALAFAPQTIVVSAWPLQLAFLVSRSSMERLADQVVAGVAIREPTWAGLFRVVGSLVYPDGTVVLVIDANPAARAGFIRFGLGVSPRWGDDGPLNAPCIIDHLGSRWWYEVEE